MLLLFRLDVGDSVWPARGSEVAGAAAGFRRTGSGRSRGRVPRCLPGRRPARASGWGPARRWGRGCRTPGRRGRSRNPSECGWTRGRTRPVDGPWRGRRWRPGGRVGGTGWRVARRRWRRPCCFGQILGQGTGRRQRLERSLAECGAAFGDGVGGGREHAFEVGVGRGQRGRLGRGGAGGGGDVDGVGLGGGEGEVEDDAEADGEEEHGGEAEELGAAAVADDGGGGGGGVVEEDGAFELGLDGVVDVRGGLLAREGAEDSRWAIRSARSLRCSGLDWRYCSIWGAGGVELAVDVGGELGFGVFGVARHATGYLLLATCAGDVIVKFVAEGFAARKRRLLMVPRGREGRRPSVGSRSLRRRA